MIRFAWALRFSREISTVFGNDESEFRYLLEDIFFRLAVRASDRVDLMLKALTSRRPP